jgi:toxin ParE1/3/4
MKVVFHVEALRDLREAADWYANESVQEQGMRLLQLVDEKVEEIVEAPASFPLDPKRPWARRARILGWPYAVVFAVREDETIVVLALAHGRRRPGYWGRRRP